MQGPKVEDGTGIVNIKLAVLTESKHFVLLILTPWDEAAVVYILPIFTRIVSFPYKPKNQAIRIM